jgi:hypothetical protein
MNAPFVATSATSRLAAISIEPDTARMRRFCLEWIKTAGEYGLTCDELETFTEMRHQTASARIVELRNRGDIAPLIGPDGVPVRRRTRSGRLAQAWVAYNIT